jgi:hypothetical protein
MGGLTVAPAQFINQMLQVRRWLQGFRTEVLLKPFADRITDRPTGLAIDLLAIHDRFRFAFIST